MKIGRVEINSCSYCGGNDFRYGHQNYHNRMYGAPSFLGNQEVIHYLICAECGAVVFTWVRNPKKYSKNIQEKSF